MNRAEYAEYKAAVADFFKREGIANLSSGYYKCPECNVEFDDSGTCPECGADQECMNEPHFSWRPCDCCGSHLGGDREFAIGYNPTTGEVQEYNICVDCVYYAEYHRLDDTTMLEVEQKRMIDTIEPIGNAATTDKPASLLTLYARRERTTDSATFDMLKGMPPAKQERYLRLNGHMDVVLYRDAACTRVAGRYPWHYPSKPKLRNRYVMLNCYRWNLVWIEPAA